MEKQVSEISGSEQGDQTCLSEADGLRWEKLRTPDLAARSEPTRSRRAPHLKELLRLLQLHGVLRRLGLSVEGRLGLVRDEGVVRDHDGRREDGGGHQDGVAVDLLHGERRGDDLLLQRVSVRTIR